MVIRKLFKKETITESAGIILFFTIIQRIIQVMRGVIFARVLGPSEYGVYTLAFFFIPLVVTFAQLGIPSCYERYIPQYEKRGRLGDFFHRNYLLTMGSSLFFTVLVLSFSKQVSEVLYATAEYKNIIILCAATILPYVLHNSFVGSFNGLRVFKMSALLTFSQFLIFTALGITLVIFYPIAESAVLANLVSFILITSVFGFIIWRYIINSNSQKLKIQEDNFYRKILKYSIWFIVTPVVFTLFRYTDRLMINHFLGLHEVGIYSVASNIAGLLFVLGVVLGKVLLPNLSKIWEQNQKEKAIFILNFATKINTLLLLGIAIVMVFFKKPIISILYGAEYLEGLSVIGVLLVFWLFNTIFWIIKGYGELLEKPYFPFIGSVVGILLNVFLNYILIPRYGILGAAVATTAAFGITLIIIFALNIKAGMTVELKTVLICLLPLILLINNITLIFISLILLGIIFNTELLISKQEKSLFFEQFKKAIRPRKI